MAVILKRPWTRQPPNGTRLDTGNPLTAGIALVTMPGLDRGRQSGGTPTDLSQVVTPQGVFGSFNGTSTQIAYPAGTLGNGDLTIGAVLRADLTASAMYILGTAYNVQPDYGGIDHEPLVLRFNSSALQMSSYNPGGTVGFTPTGVSNGDPLIVYGRVGPGNTTTTWDVGLFRPGGTGKQSSSASVAASSVSRLLAPWYVGAGASWPTPFRWYSQPIGLVVLWNRKLSDGELQSFAANPWQIFTPLPRRIWAPAGGAATHTTTGALAAAAAAIAGTATHLTLHPTSGALASAAAAIAGTATHLTLHTSTGALAAAAAAIAGSADHTTPGGTTHTTTGAPAADAAAIAGTAAHLTLHTTTGALAAGVSTIAGTAAHLTLHTTSGALQADNATISGTAQNGLFVPSAQGAGRPSKDRKPRKRRFTVTVDGEDFPVSSVEEAQEILAKVRESAEEQAEVVTERAKVATTRPIRKVLADARKSLVAPSIKVPADMRPEADALRAEIESIYNAAIQAVEIGALLRKQAEQDEEDDLLMLLV